MTTKSTKAAIPSTSKAANPTSTPVEVVETSEAPTIGADLQTIPALIAAHFEGYLFGQLGRVGGTVTLKEDFNPQLEQMLSTQLGMNTSYGIGLQTFNVLKSYMSAGTSGKVSNEAIHAVFKKWWSKGCLDATDLKRRNPAIVSTKGGKVAKGLPYDRLVIIAAMRSLIDMDSPVQETISKLTTLDDAAFLANFNKAVETNPSSLFVRAVSLIAEQLATAEQAKQAQLVVDEFANL